jgi:hypothetical protein
MTRAQGTGMECIEGFRCSITDPGLRGVIGEVLGQIRAQWPEDFLRLRVLA